MNLDDLISELKQSSSPEEIFMEKLAGNKSDSGRMQNANEIPDANQGTTVQPPAQPVSRKGKAIPKTAEWTDEDLHKVAELDQQGRIMARAFVDELNKFAQQQQTQNPFPQDPTKRYSDPDYETVKKSRQGKKPAMNSVEAGGKEVNAEYFEDNPQVNILTKLYNSIF